MGKYLAIITVEDENDEYTENESDMATLLEGTIDSEFKPDVTVYKLERWHPPDATKAPE